MYYRVPGTNGETTSALDANLVYSKSVRHVAP